MKINVNLGERSYKIVFCRLAEAGKLLRELNIGKKAGIVTNPSIVQLYGIDLLHGLKENGFMPYVIEVPEGEGTKSIEWAGKLYDRLIEERIDRGSPLLALGGGVIGDLTGFVAATFMRGIPYIQVPTSLLAQVDSSVGGKTAVNHPMAKNMIGVFYQPKLVLIDFDVLKTLPSGEFRVGMAEVIKYGIIRDENLFEFLEQNLDRVFSLEEDALLRVIGTSCAIKASIVEEDEWEIGMRAILNFGHTLGHAIEAATHYSELKHGEAVAIGMVLAARISMEMGMCGYDEVKRVTNLIRDAGLPVNIPEAIGKESILAHMMHDKKFRENRVRFVLMNRIGNVSVRDDVPQEIIERVIQ